ncbi:MAG TPA: maltose ABC transporter permease MalF [Kofleriaceae bacterium]|jgi:maltose/maltodextrin transport system permease protein|nr:maltose ABC transporter permease MalF [Kofleriaceae bacterium]
MQPRPRRIAARLAAALAALAGLAAVYQLYITGSPVLAAACAGGYGLAYFVYTARRAYTFRYLFPGLASIALFIVLPLIYTVWIGFTNYSSKNLLTFERATEVLLGEVYERSNVRYQFTLHAAGGEFRLVLHTGDEDDSAAPAFVSDAVPLLDSSPQPIAVRPLAGSGVVPGDALPLKDVIAHRDALRALTVRFPDGTAAQMASLREFTPYQALYQRNPDGSLTNRQTGARIAPSFHTGFYESASGERVEPGFRVNVGLDNYTRVFTDARFRGPFIRVFLWTVVLAGTTVVLAAGLGMLLAELLTSGLRFAWLYRLLLFLPYAVPGFISILVFKGLFNRNFGEINLILDALIGIRPNWSGNAWLARLMILIVNTWLGYPYFMLICMGLQKSIPHDLYEASALAGAGPLTNFFRITWPLIRKPLTPLLISAFAYNFNNFVLVYLLTQGRPDFLDTSVPAGETDILVTYTYRIAFEDSGQQFGLASAISTLIFAMVAILSVINLRLTRVNVEDRR